MKECKFFRHKDSSYAVWFVAGFFLSLGFERWNVSFLGGGVRAYGKDSFTREISPNQKVIASPVSPVESSSL